MITHRIHGAAIYMVTFTINNHQYTPFMLAYIPYMDPMGKDIYQKHPKKKVQQKYRNPNIVDMFLFCILLYHTVSTSGRRKKRTPCILVVCCSPA